MSGLSDRDRRALTLLAVVVALILGWYFFSGDDPATVVVPASSDSIPAAEKRLARLRQIAAGVPGKEQVLKQVGDELATREKGLIQAETAAQAQAQLLQILRKVARDQPNPIDLRNTEIGQVKRFGDRYGEVIVSATFDTGIDQLLNLLSGLTAQKELIGTSEVRIGTANPKQKTMPVRITISGLVRRELIPENKRGNS
ncbi:MAG TPA: type II secretion system protein GspM [Bryobacteraceae bacterium]|nr:type II secretion system protein GspM [Bryobacteraceae bacterium]